MKLTISRKKYVLDFIDTFDNTRYLSLGDTEFVDPKPINFEQLRGRNG